MLKRWSIQLCFFVALFFIASVVIGGKNPAIAQDSFAALKADLTFIHSQTAALLLFVPFPTNPDPAFAKHRLSEGQVAELCAAMGNCGHLGINHGTMFKTGAYDKIKQFNMKWSLEIARASDPGSVANAINENPDVTTIVRIGIAGNSIGFKSVAEGGPSDYISFLTNVANSVGGKTFYAIAGPNEPDIEKWIKTECGSAPGTDTPESQTFYNCIGEPLAKYMNAVCAANLPSNVKLLTPAFNMTSYTFYGIVDAMDKAGANWSCVDGAAGNLYPAGKSMQAYWNDEFTGKAINFLKGKGLQIYITETGPTDASIADDSAAALEKKLEDYYIQPILGINPRNKDVIRDDLIRQGYEARCATPGFDIVLEQSGQDWMQRYLKCRDDGKCNDGDIGDGAIFGGETIDQFTATMNENTSIGKRVLSILSIDYRDSLIPVWRDFNQTPQLKRSLEDYYGYQEPPSDTYNIAELKSAAINSLLTNNQRCVQSALSLLQRDEMCKKLRDPSTCALYETKVPETSLTVKQLLDAYTAYAGTSTDHQANCTNIISGPKTDLQSGMQALPLHIENAYRLAFLVTTIRTRVPTQGTMMNIFQHPHRGELGEGPDPAHVILVTAFKVPDISTNKGTIVGDLPSGDTEFKDPTRLTRDVLIPTKIREDFNKSGNEERKRLLAMGRQIANEAQDDSTMEIQCQLSGIGGQQCLDPLSDALVDIINAQSLIEAENEKLVEQNPDAFNAVETEQLFKLECDDTPSEEPQFIFDPGNLMPLDNEGRVFQDNYGAALLANLFTDESHLRPETFEYDPSYSDTESNKESAPGGFHWGLKSVFHVVRGNEGSFGNADPKRSVKHFLVYPEGYDLKTVEAVMSGTFFSTNQLTELRKKAEEYETFLIKNDQVVFDGGEISHSFTDYTERDDGRYCDTEYYNSEGELKRTDPCPTGSFSFAMNINKEPRHAGILGGRLGYWTHTIQQTLQRAQALTHKYLEKCENTEDFLLDQCGGAATTQVATPIDFDSDFNNIPSFQITYWNGSEVTFNPPSRELWDAIISSSVQHGCDPWLVLATAHSENANFVNETSPSSDGRLGLFQFTPNSWLKWKTENNSSANASHQISSCDYWQPYTFSPRTHDFSSPTNLRAAVDSACRRILWTNAQTKQSDERGFVQAFANKGENPEGEAWTDSVNRGEYVYRLWNELLTRGSKTAKSQPADYPYDSCMGQAPKPSVGDTGDDNADYYGRTTLPATGEATYYSAGVMNQVLDYRNNAEINPDLIDTCEIATTGSMRDQFARAEEQAARNGIGKVVGCAAMLRLGDVRFRDSKDKNDVRMVWVKRPPGAPSDVPEVIGPIAIIDVAASVDYPRLRSKGWIIDLDYHTFRRLFEWQGSWRRPQQGIRVCDTREQCL